MFLLTHIFLKRYIEHFSRTKALFWDLMVFYITKYFSLFHMPVKNHIHKGTFFFPSMSSFHQHFFWHFFWYSCRMSKRHKLLQNSKTNCALLKAPPGALNIWSRKRKYANTDTHLHRVDSTNSFLGLPNVFIIFSVYTYRTIFSLLGRASCFASVHVKCCLGILKFWMLSLDKSFLGQAYSS